MSKEYPCVHYYEDGKCKFFSDESVTSYCVKGPCEEETPSIADEIRAMSDEELAEFLANGTTGVYCLIGPCPEDANCSRCALKWIKQPADHFREVTKMMEVR